MMANLRIRLARWIAPRWVDIHNPDTDPWFEMQPILEAAHAWELYDDADGKTRIDVTDLVDDAMNAGLIKVTSDCDDNLVYEPTDAGRRELSRIWGPGRVPPWSAGAFHCERHSYYRLSDGDLLGCPDCSDERSAAGDLLAEYEAGRAVAR